MGSNEKKFQELSAEKIYKRLYCTKSASPDDKKRFLLADEVGLGKTITAAKVIEKRAANLKKENKSMKVGYVCSNLALAKTNADKLIRNVGSNLSANFAKHDRISLFFLDYYCAGQKYKKSDNHSDIEIFPITPATSLKKRRGNGKEEERRYAFWLMPIFDDSGEFQLLFDYGKEIISNIKNKINDVPMLLERYDSLDEKTKDKYIFEKRTKKYFDIDTFMLREAIKAINKEIFFPYIKKYVISYGYHSDNVRELITNIHLRKKLQNQLKKLEQSFDTLKELQNKYKFIEDFKNKMQEWEQKVYTEKKDAEKINITDIFDCISLFFAKHLLKLDLMLLDEVQNYADVIEKVNLSEKTDTDILYKENFKALVQAVLGNDRPVLMMSATPFRIMKDDENDKAQNADEASDKEVDYTIEQSKKSIYKQFLMTVEYLLPKDRKSSWETDWKTQEEKKKRAVDEGNKDNYIDAVNKQETLLREANILRTERFHSNEETKFVSKYESILDDKNECYKILAEELLRMKKMLNDNNEEKSMGKNFIKSTPALLSFSCGYKKFEDCTEINKNDSQVRINFTLNSERIKNKDKLFADGSEDNDSGLLYNSRIRKLFQVIFDEEEQHKLLFIPPIHSSSELGGVFKGKKGISKRLFFSDYVMTTRSLAALLSYEAERRVYNDLKGKYGNLEQTFKEGIPLTPDNKAIMLSWDKAEKKFSFKDINPEEKNLRNKIKDSLYNADKSSENNSKGSIYSYAENRDIGNKKEFCKAYFGYMTSSYSLMVMLAYCKKMPKSVYDLIMQYGADGCIHDVFDEYIFSSEYEPNNLNEEDFAKNVLNLFSQPYRVQYNGSKKSIKTHFALSHNGTDKDKDSTDSDTLNGKINRFNSPFLPFNFISTSIGSEGFDFHLYCRKIVHWSLVYNPVKFEQREGRINRYHCYANRLKANALAEEENIVIKEDFWTDLFNGLNKDKTDLVPDFVTSMPQNIPDSYFKEDNSTACDFVREFYYYPFSFELKKLDDVLTALGYYRAFLGSLHDDGFEEKFRDFIKDEKDIKKFFINISPFPSENNK